MRYCFNLLVLLILAAPQSLPQSITGVVHDPSGATVPGANVTVSTLRSHTPPQVLADSKTGDDGQFAVEVIPGHYSVCVAKEGFLTFCRGLHITQGKPQALRFVLRVNTSFSHMVPSAVMDHRLRQLAGKGAKDCGQVKANQSPARATHCAMQEFARAKAFYVRYDLQGIDSEVAGGFAGGPDGIIAVSFDSFGTSLEGLPNGASYADGNNTVLLPCPRPVALHITDNGRVSCFTDKIIEATFLANNW